ncbi:MAG TPA: Hsp20/alpha crystallin family protein [Actinomycetota bacterium]|nr:Hsp20/alpha crystallin family protein [Actinomycetota bacterium]
MVMRWDPFDELERMTERLTRPTRQGSIPMDVYRRGDEFVIDFDLPGFDPESIDLTVEKNALTLRAERPLESPEGVELIAWERPRGRFSRQVLLSEGLDTGGLKASYENGVLSVLIPVSETAKPRRVDIEGSSQRQAIETEATQKE